MALAEDLKAIMEWGKQNPIQLPQSPGSTDDLIRSLRDEIVKLQSILMGYEQWEANLVLKANWEATRDGLPALTYPLYDELMALQGRRNEALGRGPFKPSGAAQ